MASQPLASAFPRIATYKSEDGCVVRREKVRWWEDAPGVRSKLKEQRIPAEERERRAARWRAAHPEVEVKRCGDVWPKIEIGTLTPADEKWLHAA